MANYPKTECIDAAVTLLKDRCLLADGSLLDPARDDVWTEQNASDLYASFTGQGQVGSFEVQWRSQVADASEPLRLFAAEVLLVHFLFTSSVSGRRKREVVNFSLEGTGLEMPTENVAVRALDEHIGHPGRGFNTRRDLQVGYLINFVQRWKGLPPEQQQELLNDPWKLRDFADDTTRPVREMRHILLHLLCPDEFERIASGSQKRQIQSAFEGLIPEHEHPEDLDEQLYAIRQRLEHHLPNGNTNEGAIDFYHAPLLDVWDTHDAGEGVADLDALLWKKQLILYGPPGTSKTFQAAKLATSLIRREAMRRWGPAQYFKHGDALDRLIEENSFWVQLHPGYSYEEFVRGLRLEDGRTRHHLGTLFEVTNQHRSQRSPEGLSSLPVVLVLDEINRTDMSRLLGEAFSLLERDQRGKPRLLPGIDADEDPVRLVLPEDLYIIGTMNEIDQSVETLDFALRRRFLWSECPFERETLLEIVQSRWPTDVRSRRFFFEDAEYQLEMFADRAEALNQAIRESEELGSQYEVGHTYFADITFFIGNWTQGRKQRPPHGTYLWTRSGNPQPPLEDLWQRSLKPLLEQYLAGSDRRDDEVEDLRETLLGS